MKIGRFKGIKKIKNLNPAYSKFTIEKSIFQISFKNQKCIMEIKMGQSPNRIKLRQSKLKNQKSNFQN